MQLFLDLLQSCQTHVNGPERRPEASKPDISWSKLHFQASRSSLYHEKVSIFCILIPPWTRLILIHMPMLFLKVDQLRSADSILGSMFYIITCMYVCIRLDDSKSDDSRSTPNRMQLPRILVVLTHLPRCARPIMGFWLWNSKT